MSNTHLSRSDRNRLELEIAEACKALRNTILTRPGLERKVQAAIREAEGKPPEKHFPTKKLSSLTFSVAEHELFGKKRLALVVSIPSVGIRHQMTHRLAIPVGEEAMHPGSQTWYEPLYPFSPEEILLFTEWFNIHSGIHGIDRATMAGLNLTAAAGQVPTPKMGLDVGVVTPPEVPKPSPRGPGI